MLDVTRIRIRIPHLRALLSKVIFSRLRSIWSPIADLFDVKRFICSLINLSHSTILIIFTPQMTGLEMFCQVNKGQPGRGGFKLGVSCWSGRGRLSMLIKMLPQNDISGRPRHPGDFTIPARNFEPRDTPPHLDGCIMIDEDNVVAVFYFVTDRGYSVRFSALRYGIIHCSD